MKKLLSMILVVALVLSTATVALAAPTPIKATKTSLTVSVDGIDVKLDAYSINNNNYFKLGDIARALNFTNKQFNITWSLTQDAINLITKEQYNWFDEELEVNNNSNIIVTNTNSKIYVDGNEVSMRAYNINDNDYYNLRDLGEFIGFSIEFDGVNNKILIHTRTVNDEKIHETEQELGERLFKEQVERWNKRDKYKEELKEFEKRLKVSTEQPYTYSQTKLDYPYNIYVEGKGYMNFGKDKPFLDKTGALYLPIKHMSYLGSWEFTSDPETNTVIISEYYTEENTPTKQWSEIRGEKLKDLIEGKNGVRFIRSSNGSLDYENKFSRVFHADSTIITSHTYNKLTDWGREFLKSGGYYGAEYTTGMQLLGMLNMGYLEDGETPEVRTVDANYKVIEKDGTLYWERSALSSMLGNTMLTAEHEKTLYYGSDEYLQKIMQEVVNPNVKMDDSFNNGKTYMETMDDLFKGVEGYKPVK
jgi:hypothetical protein